VPANGHVPPTSPVIVGGVEENTELAWWARLTDVQRQHLKAAVEQDSMDHATERLLAETNYPGISSITPMGQSPDRSRLEMPSSLRVFIRAQP